MLVSSQQRQVTPRRKYSRGESSSESTSASLTMFTRAQASAVTTPVSAKSSVSTTHVSSQPVTTIATSASGTAITSGATEVIPNVSLTITAVAATSVHDGIPIITTSSVPALDTPTITNYVLNSLEGVHSGVPTRTTPTLTPTTLRNIEQTFLELSTLSQPESHTNQAGFVPPLVQPNGGSTYVSVDSKCWGGGTLTQIPHTSSTTSSSSSGVLHVRPPTIHTSTTSTLAMPSQIQHPPRRMGGRRPMKEEKLRPNEGIGFTCASPSLQGSLSPPHWFLDSDNCDLSVEEEEKRSMRRERNKLAAARCRKRRLDQTNLLQDETDDLEDKKSGLQQEIQLLQQQRDELEFLLATHKAVCRRRFQNTTSSSTITSAGAPIMTTAAPTSTVTSNSVTTLHHHPPPAKKALSLNHSDIFVKEEPSDDDDDMSDEDMVVVAKPPEIVSRPRRPTSLAVGSFRTSSVADLGVPIETPSAGLRGLNFESMMEGGTGLTPVTSGASGLTPLHTGLTPLTTPIVSVPTSSGNCGSQQRSSSSDLSSPDSVPPKLVSL